MSCVEILGAYLTYLLGLRPRPRRGPAPGPPEGQSKKVDFLNDGRTDARNGSGVSFCLLQPLKDLKVEIFVSTISNMATL